MIPMVADNSVSIGDIITLGLFFGSIIYILTTIVFVFLFRRLINKRKKLVVLFGIVQFVLAFLITIIFWYLWPFKFDVMMSFVFLPALTGEIISIPICLLIGNKTICK